MSISFLKPMSRMKNDIIASEEVRIQVSVAIPQVPLLFDGLLYNILAI